ncbi:LA_0364 family Cys-rich lipoprotein [Leptospira ryugenii]|uniref:LA_0364 family Cys-rich lipoprotein n=1 Tax=Leptospira ryugenii TaxID=1917863 RepID=UPI000D5970B9
MKFLIFISLFSVLFIANCGAPFSPRSECIQRNRCSTIEGECFLRNDLYYKFVTNSPNYSEADLAILSQSCLGLRNRCRKNCESSTLF